MKVLIARHSGFCDGVKRAMRIALEAADANGGLEADGPLVHNRQAVDLLELRGVSTAGASPDGKRPILIRAHGVPPEKRAAWERDGRIIVDATCVHVANNQKLAHSQASRGKRIVFAGDKEHAETRAVTGAAGADCVVVSTPEEARALPPGAPVFLLAQTTFEVEAFHEIAGIVREKFPDAATADTICRATRDRQGEAADLASRSDALVVVGGRNSANAKRLAEAGGAAGKPVFQVETAAELRDGDFAGFRVVAVISGASTPGWITQDVVNRLREMSGSPFSLQGMRLLQNLVESRAALALSAGGLALGAGSPILGELAFTPALMGSAYVFFAHTLNRRVPKNREARRLSLSDSFYRSRRSPLLALAWLSAAAALVLSLSERAAAIVYAPLILATAVYALPPRLSPAWLPGILPENAPGRAWRRFAVLRQDPETKRPVLARNWPMAAGWMFALGLPPALRGVNGPVVSVAMPLFVFCVCLGGTLIRDLHDIVSDKLIGIDTIPARIGVAKSRALASRSLGLACLLPVVAAAAIRHGGGQTAWPLFCLACPIVPMLGFLLLRMTADRKLLDAVVVQAGVAGMGCLHGLLAVVLGLPS